MSHSPHSLRPGALLSRVIAHDEHMPMLPSLRVPARVAEWTRHRSHEATHVGSNPTPGTATEPFVWPGAPTSATGPNRSTSLGSSVLVERHVEGVGVGGSIPSRGTPLARKH